MFAGMMVWVGVDMGVGVVECSGFSGVFPFLGRGGVWG